MRADDLSPIERSVSVSWSPDAAFRRFAGEFATWWPRATHSIGGPRVKRIAFEQRVGGCIYEEHDDGRRFQWGKVLAWDPPRGLTFSFHPSRDESTAQHVELRFEPEGTGTKLVLVASNWEQWGKGASVARRGYKAGWGYVLNVWAGKRTTRMAVMEAIVKIVQPLELLRHGGRTGLINSAGGEMSRA